MWRWAMLAVLAAGLMQTSAPSARAQDVAECTFFMGADPAELRWLPAELRTARCVEITRFESFGKHFLVVDVVGYDAASRDYRAAITQSAVSRAVNHYRTWFTVPDTLIIYGNIGSLRTASSSGRALAVTSADQYNCVISVDDAATHLGRTVAEDSASLQHTIAHELFHCVQQTDRTVDNAYLPWRDEGTAEFFSGRAINEAPYNNAYGRNLPQINETPLYELGESAAPFIFYLGAQRGEEAVVDMLRRAYRSPQPQAQLSTLNNIPGVDQLFHDFARAWAGNTLVDQAGRRISLPGPRWGERQRVRGAMTLRMDTSPFMITTPGYTLERGMGFGIDAPTDSDVRAVWRADGAFSELRTVVDACDEAEGGIIMTQTNGDAMELTERTINVTEEPAAMSNCRCPLGSWTIGTEALRETPMSNTPGIIVDGSVTLQFSESQVTGTYHEVTIDTRIDDNSSMRTIMYGSITWSWRRRPWDERLAGPRPEGVTDALMLERTVVSADTMTRVEFWARNQRVSSRDSRPPPRPQGSVSINPAVCTEGGLSIRPNRASGMAAAPPWHGDFRAGGR